MMEGGDRGTRCTSPLARALLCWLWVWTAFFALGSPACAQTDPSGQWRTWHTPHFRVHAQVPNAGIAEHAAREAEHAYALREQ